MSPLIDIILPVHNAAKYIDRCLTSILDQKFQNIHLIIIDDGSTDDSIKMVSKTAKKANFKIEIFRNQISQGVSKARNLGLKHLKGDYLTFVDADDWLASNHISNLVKLLESCKSNNIIPVSSIIRTKRENDEGSLNSPQKCQILSLNETFKSVLSFSRAQGYLVNKLFNNSLLNKYKIQFDEELFICEDLKFVIDYLCCTKNLIVTNDQPTYYYRINLNSVTQINNQQTYLHRGENEQLAYRRIFDSINKENLSKDILGFCYQKYLSVTINLIFNLTQTGSVKQAKIYQKQIQGLLQRYFIAMFCGRFIPPKDKIHLMVRLISIKLKLGRK